MRAITPMLTLVSVPCVPCGSPAETVQLDRAILDKRAAVCCQTVCWFCGSDAPEPYWLGTRPFCCRACAEGWAE